MITNIKKTFMFIIINIIYITCTLAQELPVPGTDEWKKLPVELRREACNIPEKELSKLTSNELLQKCLNYQFMSDILFTSEFRGGLDAIAESFNGLQEFFSRADAAKTILDYYTKLDPEQIRDISSSVEKGKFSFNLVFLELYLTQPAILKQMEGQENMVINEVMKKLKECIEINKSSDELIYSGFSINVKGLLIAVLLDNKKDKLSGELAAAYPEYKNVISHLSISELSENLFSGLILKASEL